MNNRSFSVIGLSLLFLIAAKPAFSQVSNDNEDGVNKVDQRFARDFVPGQVLVKMKDSSPASVRRNARGKFQSAGLSQLDAVLKEFGVEEMEQLLPRAKAPKSPRRAKAYNGTTIVERDLTQLYRIVLPNEKADQTLQMVEKLETLNEVEYAEPNYKLYIMDTTIADSYSDNPMASQQWYLDAYGVKELWNKPIINPKRPIIAIIDTGVDMTHPDLVDNLWTNTAEAEGEEGYDNDGNGFAGDVHGWDFVNNTPNVRDFNMHGTHVAGIAAAANNEIGIVGANPQALIMPISVMQSDGTGDIATIVKGINYATQNGADVLNLSLGTYANSRAMRQALEIAYQNAVIVAAAGNDAKAIDAECSLFYSPMFPAAYSFVLGVQATNQYGSLAHFTNYDCNGPNYSSESTLQDPDGFNYELMAPGTNILSTIPGGNYRELNGTSMASPLVAGAISALKMVKEYDTQEILWGDLLHSNNIAEAYAIEDRPAELDLMRIQLRDRKDLSDETEEDYGGDNEIDAGEIVSIYPVIRTTFGEASNIKMHLEMGDEFEDPNTVEILTDEVDFGMHLDAYGKGVSLNPLEMKIANNVADKRHIKMKVVATCDESTETHELPFTIVVTNIIKIGGLISEDLLLSANKTYCVSKTIIIPKEVTLTVEPGTTLYFSNQTAIGVSGRLIMRGTPNLPIRLQSYNGDEWEGIGEVSSNDQTSTIIEYCNIDKAVMNDWACMNNCFITNSLINLHDRANLVERITVDNCIISDGRGHPWPIMSNISNSGVYANWRNMHQSNYINIRSTPSSPGEPPISVNSQNSIVVTNDNPPYMGTTNESKIRSLILDAYNSSILAVADISNVLQEPVHEAHGIVWKVCVNGKDAQDEYEDLAPLGVGKHKFEVYFNRPMNVAVAPTICFGVRDPWTQNVVAEDGSWSADSLVYTAYKTIDGKTKSDGVNRIYVWGAEDNEFFECPYEKTRFNIMINAAGSMATGFAAEAKMGRVDLTWDNSHNDFDDAMGFNIYRYIVDDETGVADTICINREIVDLETTEFTDYDVTPGKTYYYYYKVLSTDLKEYDVSNVVAATPLTSELGDANGSGDVDVADVITTVNQITGLEPKPFIFEAADMNTDQIIDVLDVIGIIQKILPPSANTNAMAEAEATYTIENGTLYVECPVALAGVQVQLAVNAEQSITVADDLKGFEHTSAWFSDNDYLFLAYSMNGKTLNAGKHALLHIGDAMIAQIRLSDAKGHNVLVTGDDATRVNRMASDVMSIPGIYDLQGRKLTGNSQKQDLLPKGVYIIDGKKVVR